MSTETAMDHADTCGPASVEKVTPAFGQWQPIETAPEGRKIIVSVPNGKNRPPRTLMARFWPTGTLQVDEGYEGEDWAEYIDGDYYMPADWYEEFEGGDAPPHNLNPTHWMPLPKAPDSDDRTVIQNGSVNQTALSKALGTPVSGPHDAALTQSSDAEIGEKT